jgi:phosphoglycerate transporter family protein
MILRDLLLKHLIRQPRVAPMSPSPQREDAFKYWQKRTMFGMMFGYATFYLVRKNISMALPGMEEELGYSNLELGLLLTGTSLVYGIGKFLNGILADRSNPRWFMVIGLCFSALINLVFGWAGAYWALMLLWLLNGWAQSMGWPPCASLLTSWYEPKHLATWWGLWNASHQVGGAVIFILGGYLVTSLGWRSVFYIPAGVALISAVVIAWALRDRPETMGFPSPYENEESENQRSNSDSEEKDLANAWTLTRKYILTNPMIWLVSIGNFFVYIVRIGLLDWAPKFLKDARDIDLDEAGWLVAALEIAGILGGLLAGYLADRAFKGRYSLVNGLYMVGLAIGLVFLYMPPEISWISPLMMNALLLSIVGFLVYGPQMLTAVSAASYAPRDCAAAATGFNGLFGYVGATISGVGVGYCVDQYGWDGGLLFFLVAGILGIVAFAIAHVLDKKYKVSF